MSFTGYQHQNNGQTFSDWISYMHVVADMIYETIPWLAETSKLNGYTQTFDTINEFEMTMHSKLQINCITVVPENQRILRIDATDELIKIPNHLKNYKQIYHYFMLLKDSMKPLNINKEALCTLINETATKEHTTAKLAIVLQRIKSSNLKVSNENHLRFRLIITYQSWTTYHAINMVFNNGEDIISYANRVYKFSTKEIEPDDTHLSWIGSCASHTMHRFSFALSKLPIAANREHGTKKLIRHKKFYKKI